MAIKGLTDQQARFPEIGVLRKGDVQPDKGPGKDLTYFRFDTDDDNARQMFEAAYGKEPREIHCYLPFETVEENFHTSKEEWTAGALQHRCDGDTCEVWLQKDGTYSREPAPCPGGCKPVGRLKLIVPEIKRLAYVTLLTTSLWDIMNLSQRLAAYEMFMGRLNGLRFILSRKPEMISTPEVIYDKKSPDYGKPTGKRVRREKWLVFINGDPEWENQILNRMSQAVLPEGITEFNALEAPDDSDYTVDMSTGEIIEPEAPKAIKPPEPEKPDFGGNGELGDFLFRAKMELGPDEETTIAILKALGKTGFNKKNPTEADDLIALIKEQLEQPTTEPALLHVVNAETNGYYNHISHLRNAVLKAADMVWPPVSPGDWRSALVIAVQHAAAPVSTPTEEPTEEDELPF